MARILHIQASPRPRSCSTRLAGAFLDAYRGTRPDDGFERLDLFRADLPAFLAPQAAAKYAVMSGQEPADEAQAAWKGIIEVVEHFKGFDKYVLSCPMWNFGIPYRLKQYFDVIVQPGLTFRFSPDSGYTGLVTGRPMQLVLASGGEYAPGNPAEFQESYLRLILGFIGFTDIRVLRIAGTLAMPPDELEAALTKAESAAREAGAKF